MRILPKRFSRAKRKKIRRRMRLQWALEDALDPLWSTWFERKHPFLDRRADKLLDKLFDQYKPRGNVA